MSQAALKSKLEQLEKVVPVRDLDLSNIVEYISVVTKQALKQIPLAYVNSLAYFNLGDYVQQGFNSLVFELSSYLGRTQAKEYLSLEHHFIDCRSDEEPISSIETLVEFVKANYVCSSSAGNRLPLTEEAVLETIGKVMEQVGLPAAVVQAELGILIEQILHYKVIPAEYRQFLLEHHFAEHSGYPHAFTPIFIDEVSSIRGKYDLGVGIAQGGLYLAFLFELAGLPVMNVEMKRRGKGATWNPQADFDGQKLKGKKVLLLENDLDTGRTLRRASKEITNYHPQSISVCFMEGKEHCNLSSLPPLIAEHYHVIKPQEKSTEEMEEIESKVFRQLVDRFNQKYNLLRPGVELKL